MCVYTAVYTYVFVVWGANTHQAEDCNLKHTALQDSTKIAAILIATFVMLTLLSLGATEIAPLAQRLQSSLGNPYG